MSFERSSQYTERKPWNNTSTRIAQPPLAPLIQSTMKQSPLMRFDGFNGHQKDITFNANVFDATTHDTPNEPLQSQRIKYSRLVTDCHVHMFPSNEFVSVKDKEEATIPTRTKYSHCRQPLLQPTNSARDFCEIQQKYQHEIKPEIKLQPLHGRQISDIRCKPRRTFNMYKHELPEIIESESSSTADSSVHEDPPKESTTPCYKYRQSSGKHFGELVKSGRILVNGRTDTVIPQYQPNYSISSNESRAGATVPQMRQTRFDRNLDERKSYPMIEVAPGKQVRLRGADETWNAIQNDFYSPCMCVCCERTLFCIENAAYVLCPECRVVSPLEQGQQEEGGVGLGFTVENLAKWQSEMLQEYGATSRA